MLSIKAVTEVLHHIRIGQCSLLVQGIADRLVHPALNHQQARSVVIVKRKIPVGIPKRPGRTFKPFLEDHWYYEFVEDTQHKPKKSIKVILTRDVPGVGLKDDIVAAKKGLVRLKLIPEGLAEYASPENLQERALRLKQDASGPKRLSLLAQQTMQHLQSKPLRVEINEDLEWDILPKEPVLIAFRKDGVFVPDYALTLPEDPITDFGTYEITVTINGMEKIPVEMQVVKVEGKKSQEDNVES